MSIEINATEVVINGQAVAPSKKIKFKTGVPKVTSHSSLLGDQVLVTQAVDFSEAIGQVTLSFRHTLKNLELLSEWQEKVGKNAIRFIDSPTGFTKTFNQLSVEEDPEIDFDSDEFEVTFRGGTGS